MDSQLDLVFLPFRYRLGLHFILLEVIVHIGVFVEQVSALSSVSKVRILQFAQVIVQLFAGENLRIVVVIRQVKSHASECCSLLGTVTFPKIISFEVRKLGFDISRVRLSVILLDVYGVHHVFESSISRLSDVPSRSESFTIMISRSGNGFRITHFHLASVNVGLTIDECIRRNTEAYTVDTTHLDLFSNEIPRCSLDTTFFEILVVLGRDEHVGLSQS